jgi:UDP-galactopyranose mutase
LYEAEFCLRNYGGQKMYQYDYLIVGAGLYGAVMAHELHKKGKHCLVIDRRDHIAGNIYCEEIEEISLYGIG